jgi:hypothetical protein
MQNFEAALAIVRAALLCSVLPLLILLKLVFKEP